MTVTSEAEREAAKRLIAARQGIEEKRIRDQTDADILAYTAVKKAEGERTAADLQYEAKLRLAEGDAAASTRKAEGDRALKMVDVTVERERVGVEQARVEVERQSLSNKQEFEDAALKFELEKLRIDADRDVRIAAAQSMGNMMAKANVQVFGDPETMAKMSERFMSAASIGTAAEGFLRTLPPEGRTLLDGIVKGVAAKASGSKASGNGKADGATNGKAEPNADQ